MKNKYVRFQKDYLLYPGLMTNNTFKLTILVFTVLYSIAERYEVFKKDKIILENIKTLYNYTGKIIPFSY